ncbi:src homology 2 domain-containing protein sprint isoform X4 [Bombus vancouverensis nearcticus]|uniref:Protein sprint isoform X3 n=1 Tax=Bombus bifarius TaxID=103933 RepID=A0A6P8MQI4_9HYME|nr:protein sprint isoform X3 [Bombus vancouverensis nearcticus]XP_033193901.1 protein sprint isoform X3 [Bombus vancouverensis nearcticus]XP_033304631.1 protein sprint isoform X3 [Bombus bifarius]XP_033304632.1 protein sprint isoform X3 [Bombus bifarius]
MTSLVQRDLAPTRKRESTSSNASSYLMLLNSLATDLDCMLSELCTTPNSYERSDVFLEPYLQQHGTVQVVSSPSTPPPNPLQHHQLTQLHHVQSEESLSSEGSATSGGSSSSTEDSGSEVACDITLIERLIRSHPIWFLPGIQRAGAFHLLQGKEEGNFVVRQSSQSDTMALSVRLPPGKGPYIEHYLIQANKGKLSLETSENRFDNIPSLIAHYSQCCDELPVQLTLPRAMREAKNRQQLSSLALLGQEFWRYPMANPKPPESSSSNTSSLSSFRGGNNNLNNNNNNIHTPTTESIVLNLAPISSHDTRSSSPTGALTTTTFASSLPRQPRPTPPNTLNLTTFNEPLDLKKEKISPGDKLSQKLISPNLVQSVRCPSPVVHNVESNVLSPVQDTKVSFESKTMAETSKSTMVELSRTRFSSVSTSMMNFHQNVSTFNNLSCTTSPVLPEIRNIIAENHSVGQNVKTPPPPPPRWAKPAIGPNQNNFSVTTTVTFNVNHSNDVGSSQNTPSDPNTSLLSPQSATSNKSLTSNFSVKSPLSPTTPILSPMSKLVPNTGVKTPNVLSPTTPSSTSKSKRRRDREARKNSQHYQESDILESYYRSSPGDKISDYEDIWNTTDQSNHSTWSPNDKLARNDGPANPQDRLRNSNDRLMVPDRVANANSERNFNERLPTSEQLIVRNDRMIVRNDKSIGNEKLSYKEMTSPEFSSFKPAQEAKPVEQSNGSPEETGMGRRPDLLSRVSGSANSLNSPSTVTPPRNKLGLMLAKSESNSPLTPESKQGSPFYAEPADAIAQSAAIIPRRRPRNNPATNKYRHSEPGWLQNPVGANSNQLHPIDWEESEETEDKTPLISSSVDNLAKRLGTKETKKIPRAKPVQPPKIRTKVFNDTSWAVDSSWEFIGNEGDDCDPDYDCDADYEGDNVARKFPDEECDRDVVGNTLTVQSIILQRYPELLKPPDTSESLYSDRNSSYDNVEKRNEREEAGDTRKDQTYDSSEWETPLETDESDVERMKRNKSFKERLDPLLSPPRLQALRNRDNGGTGSSIRSYALQLAADKTTTFSQNIDNFIQCTKEGKEASPHVVMRNMRQFMSGMKNYLVKHGEKEFEKEVEKERLKLKANEFLNLDAILEGVMMNLVVRPLREHVYRLFVDHYATTGSLQTLAESIQHAQGKHIQDLGVRPKIIPPSEPNLERILKCIDRLQKADSPLDKLENLLAAFSAIFNSVKHANSGKHLALGADDLLPLLVWVLVRGRVVDAEVEAEYMWGLLHPSLLTGEGGYYLTTLSSAVHVLKTFKSSQGTMSTLNGCGTPDCSSVLRILVPDELHGSLNTRTLPVRPNMNTREICRILAHKIRCTNPQDYGLFKLVQGEETLLGDHECPQELSHCLFAYKRIDAKIAWPKTSS